MAKRGRPRHPDVLTPREWDVLALVREGLTNDQIAERLGITERTARFHVSEILSKLGVSTRQEAAAWQPEEQRPWWSFAFAPFSFGRAHRWLATALGGATIAVAVAGVAVLAWGLTRTDGESSAVAADATPQKETLGSFVELRAVNGVLKTHAAAECGDAATAAGWDVPQALEFNRERPFDGPPTILGLEAVPYEYVNEQLVTSPASHGWEASQRPLLYWSVPGGFFLPEFFLRRLDRPDKVFRYGADLCVQADGQRGSPVYASEGSSQPIELPPSLPRVVIHRPPSQVTASQAIAVGQQGAWARDGTRVVWAEYGNSDDFARTRGERRFPPLNANPEAEYWAVIIAMGDAGGPHRTGHEVGTYITIDANNAGIRSYGCCLRLAFTGD